MIKIKNACNECRFERDGGICSDCWKVETVKEITRIKFLKLINCNKYIDIYSWMNETGYINFDRYLEKEFSQDNIVYDENKKGDIINGVICNGKEYFFKNYKKEKNINREDEILTYILEITLDNYLNELDDKEIVNFRNRINPDRYRD
ncbi:hypothetical protein EOM39_01200 [Candidatus Gracilibacteria bacterium]|nr:hypothetical protein [Candidatus Gracilibacteria bacterium]